MCFLYGDILIVTVAYKHHNNTIRLTNLFKKMKYPAKNPAKFLKPELEPDIEAGYPAGSGFSRISGRFLGRIVGQYLTMFGARIIRLKRINGTYLLGVEIVKFRKIYILLFYFSLLT